MGSSHPVNTKTLIIFDDFMRQNQAKVICAKVIAATFWIKNGGGGIHKEVRVAEFAHIKYCPWSF